MPVITLLTDFGQESFFPAAMKGIMLGICPQVTIVDVTHHVPEHDVVAGGYALYATYRHFPQGTVHVGVVDPGVGGERRIVALEIQGHILLTPDNGLLSFVLKSTAPDRIFQVENRELMNRKISPTFHGRDVFAPVAAHLARGVPLEEVGRQISEVRRLDISSAKRTADGLEGEIISVDRFGNIVTNIRSEMLPELPEQRAKVQIRISGQTVRGICRTYADVALGQLVSYVGSNDLLEIGRNRGSARDVLGAGIGHKVRVIFGK